LSSNFSFVTKAPFTIDWKNWLDIMTTKAGNSILLYSHLRQDCTFMKGTGREVYVLAFEIIYTGVRWFCRDQAKGTCDCVLLLKLGI
jgi:hypothetical protein